MVSRTLYSVTQGVFIVEGVIVVNRVKDSVSYVNKNEQSTTNITRMKIKAED